MSAAQTGPPTAPGPQGIGIPTSSVASPGSMQRRPELDFMRAFVVAGLVVFHSAIVFTTVGSWFVNDPRPSVGFDVFVLWGMTWGMPLLFVVSGMGVHYALRTRSAGAFLRERFSRLLVPFVVGMAALVPPMFYLERLGKLGFHEPYGHFWLRFVDVPALAGGVLSRGVWRSGGDELDPAHMWFLYVLLLLSVALLPLFLYLRRPAGMRLIDRIADAVARHPITMLLAGAVPMGAVEAVFGPDKVTGGWERLAYLFPLLFGFVIASNRRFDGVLRRERGRALACALVSTALLVWWAGRTGFDDIVAGDVPGWGALQGLAGWAWIMAILGFAGSWTARWQPQPAFEVTSPGSSKPRLSRAARYANEAVLPFYVLHEPVTVGAAWIIVRWHAPILAKYLALVIVSFAGTLTLYDVFVRRWRVTRFLFGMKARSQRTTPARADEAGAPQVLLAYFGGGVAVLPDIVLLATFAVGLIGPALTGLPPELAPTPQVAPNRTASGTQDAGRLPSISPVNRAESPSDLRCENAKTAGGGGEGYSVRTPASPVQSFG